MAVNWALLQTPDIAGNALQAFNQGQQQGRERALRNALTAYAGDPSQISQVIAADPATGIQLQRQNEEAKRQAAADMRTEDAATREQHRIGTLRLLTALRNTPQAQRAQRAQELFQQNDMGWTPEQVWQNASVLAQNPNRLSDEGLNSAIAAAGGDPNAGAYNLGPNEVRYSQDGRVIATGPSEPIFHGDMWSQPQMPAVGSHPGAPAAQPAIAAPQQSGQGGQGMDPQSRDMLARLLIGEAPQGPGQVAVANVVLNRSRLSGRPIAAEITAPHQFEPVGNATRWQELQSIPTTDPRYQAALAAVDQALQNDVTGGATHFYSPSIMDQRGGAPSWAQGQPGTDIGGNRFLRLPYAGQQAPQTANQTAPQQDPSLPPGYHRMAPTETWQDVGNGQQRNPRTGELRGTPRTTYRDATAAEQARYGGPGQVDSNGQFHPITNGAPSPRQQRRDGAALRQQFNQLPDVREFEQAATAYEQIVRLGRSPPTAANDIGLIFSYMRMLDPTSTVREGEFATAQNAAGVPDRVRNAYNQVMSGQRLNPTQREQFIGTAQGLYNTRRERYDQRVEEYRGYARDYELDPSTVITPRRRPGAGRQAGPGVFQGANTEGRQGPRGSSVRSTPPLRQEPGYTPIPPRSSARRAATGMEHLSEAELRRIAATGR